MSRKLFTALAFAAACVPAGESFAQDAPASHRALLDRYCVTCHNERLVAGRGGAPSPLVSQLRAIGLTLDTLDLAAVGDRPEVWETVVRKLRGGVMPPAGRPRPDDDATLAFAGWLESELDRVAAARPDPGRTAPLHRLNRAEYRNAVRDLLALEVDVDALLPADDSSYGFDNIETALRMSQSLLERYLAAATTVSRLAVGSPPPAVVGETYRLATDIQQHDRMDGLPFGTRGGALVTHLFPQQAEYDIQVELGRARNVSVTHRLEIAVDGEQVELVTARAARRGRRRIESLRQRLERDGARTGTGWSARRRGDVLPEPGGARRAGPPAVPEPAGRRGGGADTDRQQRHDYRSLQPARVRGDAEPVTDFLLSPGERGCGRDRMRYPASCRAWRGAPTGGR